jgi:hypothetical protein
MDYKKINFEDILNWCFENDQKEWLKKRLDAGESFLVIKEAFVLKFMPEIKPPKKEKPLTMLEKFEQMQKAQ